MCQILRTEHFMGMVAVSFLSQGKKSIKLDKFFEIERKASKSIRQSDLDAVLCISMNELHSTVSEYNNLFEITNQNISFFEDKVDLYRNYFFSGISKKITDQLTSYILE